MLDSEISYKLIPFPLNHNAGKNPDSVDKFYFRTFGHLRQDLEIDFNNNFPPALINSILENCMVNEQGNSPKETVLWELEINKRILCLLLISGLTNSQEIFVEARCPNKSCNELIEAGLPVQDFFNIDFEVSKDKQIKIIFEDKRLYFRRPKGTDQLRWLNYNFDSEEEASKLMFESLLVNPGQKKQFANLFSKKLLDKLNNKFDELDPIVNFNFKMRCPYCESKFIQTINLEERAIQKLIKSQKELFYTIHLLAINYHWNENEIFSIPPHRRQHYLNLIQKQDNL